MGDGSIACGVADGAAAEMPVLTLHSNCVLSFDVDKPRAPRARVLREGGREAAGGAVLPDEVRPDGDRAHPGRRHRAFLRVRLARLRRGTSSRGRRSSIWARAPGSTSSSRRRKSGAAGRAIGVDMTDPMLAVANENRPLVAEKLGYDAVEFRKGFLEAVPAEDKSVDAVTSNCVVNLSPDKGEGLRGDLAGAQGSRPRGDRRHRQRPGRAAPPEDERRSSGGSARSAR